MEFKIAGEKITVRIVDHPAGIIVEISDETQEHVTALDPQRTRYLRCGCNRVDFCA